MTVNRITNRLLSWAGPDLESQALDQALRSSRLPFIEGHVALMPDAHFGMGATVGSVIPTRRKGAIKAAEGDRGVIPGSMGTRSYIVSGLGSTAAYCSCSHGAGRRMSRGAAKRELTFESLEAAMKGKTWNHDAALLDEHPDSYKDIDVVMENQRDLVQVEHTLSQVLNYKGT